MSTTVELDEALSDIGIFSLDPMRRKQIAQQLAASNVTCSMVKLVWAECSNGLEKEKALGIFASAVQDPGRMITVAADFEDKLARRKEKRGGSSSGMQHVTKENPYGWAEPEAMRGDDHSIPGEWNPFRQCYNLTQEEATKLKRIDVRRFGCSRFEVCKTIPDIDWNEDVVATVNETLGKVYGEA